MLKKTVGNIIRRSTRAGFVSLALTLSSVALLAGPPEKAPVIIDGKLTDRFWQGVTPARLVPAEAHVPADLGGEVRVAIRGGYLYLGARLPEPDGRLTARSIGRNPVWEGGEEARTASSFHWYSYGGADGEDFLRAVIRVYNENDWMVQVGPFGAYAVKWRWTGESDWYTSRPERCDRFLVATEVGETEWRVELAIPLDQLWSPAQGAVRLSVERNRAIRPGQPQERWRWPEYEPTVEIPAAPTDAGKMPDPVFQPALFGNSEPPMEVGRRTSLPPIDSGWNDPRWRDVPVWSLRRNEPLSQLPRFPADVKLMHDDRTLAVIAKCAEPDGVVAKAKERDGLVDQDDSFQILLATSGSSYVHYAINPLGYLLDASGHSGGPRVSRPYVDWNSPVRSMVWQERGEWVVRLDLPLDDIAQVLGEVRTPREWRVLLLRYRPPRDGEPEESSVLPVTESVTPICPSRYRRLKLVESDPSHLHGSQMAGQNGILYFVPTRVLSAKQRKEMDLAEMLDHHLQNQAVAFMELEKRNWDTVKTVQDWERFRDRGLKALTAAVGEFPPRSPLQTRVAKEFRGDGYRRQDLVYQSQSGFWVTANLYLPAQHREQMPGIIVIHSLHGPKTHFELQDMGILWGRAGCAVLIMDQIGYGERLVNYPWDREAYHSRYTTGIQLYLTGSSLMTWMVWNIMRGVDLLLERQDVNSKQIVLLGSVAGGGEVAAVTAALDARIAAVAPFNLAGGGEKVSFMLKDDPRSRELADPGWGDWESQRALQQSIVNQFPPWMIAASVAPRRLIFSHELGWDVEKLQNWTRFKKVFGLYDALDHLAEAHGFGSFPGPGECWHIGADQRKSLEPTLERWFGIPIPFSDLTASKYANLAKQPGDRQPESELDVLNPAIASAIRMRSVHELTHQIGQSKVAEARSQLSQLKSQEKREWIRSRWSSKLGDIEPIRHPEATLQWSKRLPSGEVEGITLNVEPGIVVPLLLLRPTGSSQTPVPVVAAVSEGGKEGFLAARSHEIEGLLKAGIAVCLPDVRGTGETSPTPRRDPDGDTIDGDEIVLSSTELMLGQTLLGQRLKDLRTVLAYLRSRQDLDSKRLGLWGDSFTPVNPAHLILDEQPNWQVGPEIKNQAEPLGGLLAILGALYEDNVRTIAIRHGLASYLSILEDRFIYVPEDIIIPGILQEGDIADATAVLAPRPLLFEDLVDGRNRLMPEGVLLREMDPLYKAYQATSPDALAVRSGEHNSNFAEWFIGHI